jgi:hypothetical protein
MKRDSTFDEQVLWTGRPKVVTLPRVYRVAAIVCGLISVVTTASAVVVSTALGAETGQLLFFGAWMATMSMGLWYLPRWWRSQLEYVVTDGNIVLRRGKLRRYIDRRAISFARIHWHPTLPGIGDLELVRAVPTGALRRRLSIVLTGLVAPDRVWAIIRGVTPAAAAGDGVRPLAQRLDEGERVLWSAHPEGRWRRWLPAGWKARWSVLVGMLLLSTAIFTIVRSVQSTRSLLGAGLDPDSASFVALVVSFSLTILLLAGSAVAIVYSVVVRPARLDSKTRYLITNQRVLIQRGEEELHLDRSKIVDVIDAPAEGGRHDLFLVLDGPKAKALAPSGAFGEEAEGLQPVLFMIEDAEAVTRLLRGPHPDPETSPFPIAA